MKTESLTKHKAIAIQTGFHYCSKGDYQRFLFAHALSLFMYNKLRNQKNNNK